MPTKVRRPLIAAYFGLLAVIVFATQFAGTGFGGEGQHYSWVPSHALAIASRATAVNGFVGHARSFLDADGAPDYLYFDRYPFFFSALLGALTSLTDDLATKVWIARQLMHVMFVLTMLFAWLLLRSMGIDARLALVSTTLAFSGHMLLRYRELIHFDQPALLGMMILLYVIARVKLEGRERWRWLTVAALLAVSLGRGFLSLGVLGLWAAVEAAGLLWQRERPPAQRLQAILRHDATRVLLLALAWSGLALAYNVAHEMARREVPFAETTIAQSIQYRLPGGKPTSDWQADYNAFAVRMESRIKGWYSPLAEENSVALRDWVSLPLLLLVVYYHLRRQSPARRIVFLLTALSGLAWLFVMINLAWFH
ncbi:MAG: phospholipid carrier-dependent glycosyltransferase, partial [Anaerolineaceae bacterium]|nr:phospholipid carrier-dependent glycosyltransferase [Anaerolineaceae bacterium]